MKHCFLFRCDGEGFLSSEHGIVLLMTVIDVETHLSSRRACYNRAQMSLNIHWLGNGEWFSTWFCYLCLNYFPSACKRKPDEPDQPCYAEPGEQVADRSIDCVHALRGDVGYHHLGIGGKVVRG